MATSGLETSVLDKFRHILEQNQWMSTGAPAERPLPPTPPTAPLPAQHSVLSAGGKFPVLPPSNLDRSTSPIFFVTIAFLVAIEMYVAYRALKSAGCL